MVYYSMNAIMSLRRAKKTTAAYGRIYTGSSRPCNRKGIADAIRYQRLQIELLKPSFDEDSPQVQYWRRRIAGRFTDDH